MTAAAIEAIWRQTQRAVREYEHHPIATGHRAVYFATCEHCADAKENP